MHEKKPLMSKKDLIETLDIQKIRSIKQAVFFAVCSMAVVFSGLYVWHTPTGMVFSTIVSFIAGLVVADRLSVIVSVNEKKNTIDSLDEAHDALIGAAKFIEEQEKMINHLDAIIRATAASDDGELERYERDMKKLAPKKDPMKN